MVSIVEALPQKLTKLAGITLIRNTGPTENSEKKASARPSAPKIQTIDFDFISAVEYIAAYVSSFIE